MLNEYIGYGRDDDIEEIIESMEESLSTGGISRYLFYEELGSVLIEYLQEMMWESDYEALEAKIYQIRRSYFVRG